MASRPSIGIQWHITNKCTQRCRHCYLIRRNAKRAEIEDLPFEKACAIVDCIVACIERFGAKGSINLTGGDPLLYEHIWGVLKYVQEKGLSVSILGNSYKIDDTSATKLRELGVRHYQISIDGLEENHDWLRKEGSFSDSMRAFDILQKHDIGTGIMYTVIRRNRNDLLPVMRLAAQRNLRSFAFDVVTPNGKDDNINNMMLSPLELREVYLDYVKEAAEIWKRGSTTIFARKNNLHFLIAEEGNKLYPVFSDTHTLYAGCPIGQGLAICADGRVIPCPRIPIVIGQLPHDDMADILLYAGLLRRFRNRDNFKKCSRCTLFQYCRGCPANAYATTGDFFAGDPYCWKEVDHTSPVQHAPKRKIQFGKECKLSAREREIMGIYYSWQFTDRTLKNDVFQEILGRALRDMIFRKELAKDLKGTCHKYHYEPNDVMLYELSRVEFNSFFNLLEGI